MLIHNVDVAQIFDEIADLIEINGDNPFRIRAYRNGARILNALSTSVQTMVEQHKDLKQLPGIGPDLAARITEIVTTGTCALREQLRQTLPPAIAELLKVPGMGPKRIQALYLNLDIQTLEQLYAAALDGRIRNVPGFGERVEQRILEAVRSKLSKTKRFQIAAVAPVVERFSHYLKSLKDVKKVEIAGSFRRMQETVGDLDILVSSPRPKRVAQQFVGYEEVDQVLAHGSTRASVMLRQGMQVDLRIVAEGSFGAALHYFTGSKGHNIALRKLAQERDLKMNEYGIFSGDQRIAGETEESVFNALGLTYIEPELRENRGEIEAAQHGRLPALLTLSDLQGDLHAHTTATDGHNSLREMALAAQRFGLHYLGITEHSQSLAVAHGLNAGRLSQQIDEIDQLNNELDDFTLLKGIEVDILEDGQLDLPDRILQKLDYVIGAVHAKFDLPRERQTERILRAMDHRCFTLLAHPSGRLIDQREPYDVDIERIIRHAKQRGCFLELDAQPSRLDLTDVYCRMAKDEGVLISIDSDAHNMFDFNNLRFGIGQARRGWLEREDVLNTRPVDQLKRLFTAIRQ
jgi:DNA polymerase (family X)